MPAGWRSVVVQHWPDQVEYGNRKTPGQVSVVQVLPPDAPDPSQQQLDTFAAVHARYGGYATARVVERLWWPYPVLTDVQQRAAAGLP